MTPAPKTQLFISYKTGLDDGLTQTAHTIRRFLENSAYDVWMDETDLQAGQNWNTQIYEALSKTDIVLLLLSEGASNSDWVRREIDVARGARVHILPVLVRGGFDTRAALDRFDLGKAQYIDCRKTSDTELAALVQAVENSKHLTRYEQREWLTALMARGKSVAKSAFTPVRRDYAVYRLPDDSAHTCRIVLAAGDMLDMNGIDVLVNTENNYMQMARVFESTTLSSKLRLYGALLSGGHIREDTVQQELYEQTLRLDEYRIPLAMGCVVPTHAGHPNSRLVQRGARYIFHVATVAVQPAVTSAFIPTDDSGVREGVLNCIDKIIKIDRSQGRISPPGSARRTLEDQAAAAYRPIESIIFPMFATGRGGRENEVQTVASTILHALISGLGSLPADAHSLKNVYLCAYSDLDVQAVKAAMDGLLPPA
jgi:hypothetical protein